MEIPERLDENGQSPYGQNGHMSHTEVDQAMLFPKSSSQVPLTGTNGSTEKRPRFVFMLYCGCCRIVYFVIYFLINTFKLPG